MMRPALVSLLSFACGALFMWNAEHIAQVINILNQVDPPEETTPIDAVSIEVVKVVKAEPKVPVRSIRSNADQIARRIIGNRGAGHLYAAQFRAAVYLYWPAYKRQEWVKLLAQCKVESGLKPDAESPAGAVGVCQFMPGAWSDWLKVNKNLSKDRKDATSNINAAARYMASLFRFWRAPRSWECREELAQASYNWGAGRVHRQQVKYGGVCVSDFNQDFPKETKDYIERVRKTYEELRKL